LKTAVWALPTFNGMMPSEVVDGNIPTQDDIHIFSQQLKQISEIKE
jgi:hypothetical protein